MERNQAPQRAATAAQKDRWFIRKVVLPALHVDQASAAKAEKALEAVCS